MRYVVSVISIVILLMCSIIYGRTIQAGDVVEITVVDHPEFSGRYEVDDRGMIEYPLLMDNVLINSNTNELMQELTFVLARHIDNPFVMVSIVQNPQIAVAVLGQVMKPGTIQLIEGATVQEAIIAAGGPIPEKADLTKIRIIPSSKNRRPEMFNMEIFLVEGTLELMPRLSNGDAIVVLTSERPRSVKVIGAVQKPGLFILEEKMNLFEAVYLAGGPTEKADLSRVRRFSIQANEEKSEEIIDLQNYIDNGKMDNIPDVFEGDVIIVYARWFDWKTVLAILNNTLLFLITIQTFAGIIK